MRARACTSGCPSATAHYGGRGEVVPRGVSTPQPIRARPPFGLDVAVFECARIMYSPGQAHVPSGCPQILGPWFFPRRSATKPLRSPAAYSPTTQRSAAEPLRRCVRPPPGSTRPRMDLRHPAHRRRAGARTREAAFQASCLELAPVMPAIRSPCWAWKASSTTRTAWFAPRRTSRRTRTMRTVPSRWPGSRTRRPPSAGGRQASTGGPVAQRASHPRRKP